MLVDKEKMDNICDSFQKSLSSYVLTFLFIVFFLQYYYLDFKKYIIKP